MSHTFRYLVTYGLCLIATATTVSEAPSALAAPPVAWIVAREGVDQAGPRLVQDGYESSRHCPAAGDIQRRIDSLVSGPLDAVPKKARPSVVGVQARVWEVPTGWRAAVHFAPFARSDIDEGGLVSAPGATRVIDAPTCGELADAFIALAAVAMLPGLAPEDEIPAQSTSQQDGEVTARVKVVEAPPPSLFGLYG